MIMHDPTIDQLRKLIGFVDAAQAVTAAAERLGIEQYTLSRRLAVFKSCGADNRPILETRDGHLRLTPKGKTALPAIRDLVRQYEQLLAFLEGTTDEPQIVRVGLGHFAMRHYMPRVLTDLAKHGARLIVEPCIARGRDRILGVARGEFNLAVVTHHPSQIDTILSAHLSQKAELCVESLARQPLCVVARQDTPAGKELAALPPTRKLPLTHLLRWPLVGLDEQSGIRRLIETELRASHRSLQFTRGTGTGGWPAAKEFARAGLGVAILPLAELSANDWSDLAVRQLAAKVVIQDYLIHRDCELNDPQQLMKQELRQAARDHEKTIKEKLRKNQPALNNS